LSYKISSPTAARGEHEEEEEYNNTDTAVDFFPYSLPNFQTKRRERKGKKRRRRRRRRRRREIIFKTEKKKESKLVFVSRGPNETAKGSIERIGG
jgi:hypothetical protein